MGRHSFDSDTPDNQQPIKVAAGSDTGVDITAFQKPHRGVTTGASRTQMAGAAPPTKPAMRSTVIKPARTAARPVKTTVKPTQTIVRPVKTTPQSEQTMVIPAQTHAPRPVHTTVKSAQTAVKLAPKPAKPAQPAVKPVPKPAQILTPKPAHTPAPKPAPKPAEPALKPAHPRHNPTAARRLLGLVLAIAGIATFLSVVGLWPTGDAPKPRPGFLESQSSATESVKGTVVKQTTDTCNSPDVGRVFEGDRRPSPMVTMLFGLADTEPPKCQISVIELTSGPDKGKKTLLEASGLPGEVELNHGDKIVLALHRPGANDAGPSANPETPPAPVPEAESAPAPAPAPAPDGEIPPPPPPAPEGELPPPPPPGPDGELPPPPPPPAETPEGELPPPPPPGPAPDAADVAPKPMADANELEPGNTYTFLDMDRTVTLWLWLGAAVLLIAFVGMGRGLLSLAGLGITLAAVLGFLVPALLRGGDPVGLAITASSFILFPVLFLVHGVNWKSASALAGSLSTMLLAAGLANLAIFTSDLRGLGDDDNLLIQLYLPDVSVNGLLLTGFIIGALGVLNDVTISQASTVQELYEANPRSRPMEVFRSAMRVGRDHISSMVYTLVLAYLGTALPLSLLLSVSNRPLMQSLTSDVVATELLRSVVGAVALVLAVPITTFIAAHTVAPQGMVFPKRSREPSI